MDQRNTLCRDADKKRFCSVLARITKLPTNAANADHPSECASFVVRLQAGVNRSELAENIQD
jgi:hypothetical protein